MDFTHLNKQGHARMVDVSDKPKTARVAKAAGKIIMAAETLAQVKSGGIAKGDVLAVAQVAGIMAAKKTSDTIPMCHPLMLTGVDISFEYQKNGIAVTAVVKCNGETGAEMEALNAVSATCLTIYDMCKSIQKNMT
ncbi:MAG: cyclic pyranopterin monophosphate synthase MoaC, partial [Eubacteriales bacterium]